MNVTLKCHLLQTRDVTMIIRNMNTYFANDRKMTHLCYVWQLPGHRLLDLHNTAEVGKEVIGVGGDLLVAWPS